MSDDEGIDEESAAEREPSAALAPQRSWLAQNRALALGLGSLGLCGLIGVDIYFMLKSDAKRGALVAAASSGALSPRPASEPAPAAAAPEPSGASADEPTDGAEAGAGVDYESDDGEPKHTAKPAAPKHFASVQQAAVDSCTTASVDGLSRQIIAQARCIKPNAFVPLPSRPNLVIASQVFPYLSLEARDHLLKAVDARPKLKMTVNSALRTVAQQYLVWRWSATKRCGVPLATPPGESNHEVGVALDIAEAGSWRPLLEAQDFKWLGSSDRVHFDYKGATATPGSSTDVLAFQKLWNRNHPTDKITEDGRYSPNVEQRLKQAPPDGFTLGPSCSKANAPKK
jgi:D-alanyl-D-alanine carboxypeptidase